MSFKSLFKSIGKHIAVGALEAIAEAAASGKPITAGNVLLPGAKAAEQAAIEGTFAAVSQALQEGQK